MIVAEEKLPYITDCEETIYLSYITLRRKYKKNKTSKNFIFEETTLRESFLHKGKSPEVVIRRRGVLNRFRKLTGWTKGVIEIVKLDYQVHLGKGCEEPLIDISKINL